MCPSPSSLSALCPRPEVCVLSPPAKLPFEESSRQQAAQDMELVISYYCKTRNLHYQADYGWTEILLVLSSIGMNKADLFNCFYAMMAKYIPRHVSLVCQVTGIDVVHVVSLSGRDCKADGRPFHLFRLLLLYHDPGLCSFFDTMKLAPEDYLLPWVRAIIYVDFTLFHFLPPIYPPYFPQFRSLFASTCGLEVVHVMWDLYLLERDPFLVLFLALVMILNAK